MSLTEKLRLHAALFLVAVPLNLAWEVTQIMAYDFPQQGLMANLIGCLVPSLGDGLMTLIIYWSGWLTFRDPGWILRLGVTGYVLMALVGFLLAVGIEWNALYRTGAWEYTPRMPRIPIVGVGLLPVLQMLILPPASVLFIRRCWQWREERR